METIRLDLADDRATITLTRPPLNVLTIAMMREMRDAIEEAASRSSLRCLVLAAEGKAFCAGVDVGEHVGDVAREMLDVFNGLLAGFLDFPAPTIALVEGQALGGGMELCLAVDMVLASEKAVFAQPEIKVGVYPPPATVLLPFVVGRRRAAEIILTGRGLSAAEAREAGLVNHVYPEASFADEAEGFLSGLTKLSGSVLHHAVEVLRSGEKFRRRIAPVTGHYLDELMETKDAKEGIAAFLEKRRPTWTHE